MKFNKFKVAAIQMNSREDVQANLDTAIRLIREAAHSGARVVAVPENFLYIGPDKSRCLSKDGKEIIAIRELAQEREIIIVAGSIREKTADEKLPHNVCYVIAPDGLILEEYRKIHLFDVDLPTGEKYRESEEVTAGSSVKVLDTSFGRFGLTICYDLRFPELYRKLALKGAQTIFVPSNFTLHTGKDHWLTLVKARAIENTCYVVAPAQIGHKYGLRASFGKTVIVDPWGSILAKAPDKDEAVVIAEIDLDYLKKVRQALPALSHIKLI